MKDSIHQFMWGFQQHFRVSVEIGVQDVLSRIGLHVNDRLKVLLIGLATKENLPHAICIEPEDGPLVVEDLISIKGRTQEVSRIDPEFGVSITTPRYHDRRQREIYLRSRARAFAEAIEGTGKFEGLRFFVSNSAPIEGFDVHTCLGIPKDVLDSVPGFSNPMKNDYHGWHIEESFAQAIINTCLYQADRALYLPYPGEGLNVLGDRIHIIRRSAERFIDGVTTAMGSLPSDLFRRISEISSLTYERSDAEGHLVVTRRDNLTNKLRVSLEKTVGLNESRAVRKLLEVTNDYNALLTDGGVIYGLGECISAPDIAKVAIDGHARWSLSIDDTVLMRVAYEHATLPKQILDKKLFRDVAERTVGAINVDRIWDTFQCALDSGHGTTIVVSEEPLCEIGRLGQEALAIKPEYLEHEDVARLGSIDGAIMLGADGKCYAFGVILDGLATSSGDRSRGARFNSSVRYQRTSKLGTMVIVISDDGTVDLVPKLMPRVWRQAVEDAVQAFCEYSALEGNDGEEWARRNRDVERLRFYLNQEQCDRVNEAYEKEMDSRFASDGIKTIRNGLRPHPDMEDSYFWDSEGSVN